MPSIPYNVVQKVDPRDPTQPKKYYAAVHLKKTSTYRDLINRISSFSTVNHPDVLAVMESFIHIIPELLSNGEIVRLGDFGSFYLSVNSTGSEEEEEVTGDNILRTNVRFRPGSLINDLIDRATFRKFNISVD